MIIAPSTTLPTSTSLPTAAPGGEFAIRMRATETYSQTSSRLCCWRIVRIRASRVGASKIIANIGRPWRGAHYPADLTLTMQAGLAALADIDKHYEQRRHNLENRAGPQKMKEPIVREVAVCHKRECDTHMLRLGQLHERIMALTMFRNLHTKH